MLAYALRMFIWGKHRAYFAAAHDAGLLTHGIGYDVSVISAVDCSISGASSQSGSAARGCRFAFALISSLSDDTDFRRALSSSGAT